MKYYKLIQTIIITSIIVIIGLWLTSCDSFTEIDLPQSQLTGKAVFQDASTATAALSDCYAQLRETGLLSGKPEGLSSLMGNYADELTYFGSSTSPIEDFYNHTVIASNPSVAALWQKSYSQLYNLNAVIEGLDNSTAIPQDTRNQLKGEGLFLRATLHFYLVNLYGAIPYVTTTNYSANSKIARTAESEVYEKIIADLIQSKELLSHSYPSSERIRPNKAVATALLAKVYLYKEDWAAAEREATVLIENEAQYKLEVDLDKVFLKESTSVIWQLHPGIAGLNTHDASTFIFTSGPPPIAALSTNLVNAFEVGDQRKVHWLANATEGSQTWYYPYKYKQNGNSGTSQEYAIVLRLEEQYLIRAEARAHQEKGIAAIEDLNKIRNRAGLTDITSNDMESIVQAIFQERRVELFTELGQRWFDLKRSGKDQAVISALKPGWKSTDKYLPVPESELVLNKNLYQNPGY